MTTDATDTNAPREPYGSPETVRRQAGRRTGVTIAAAVALTATLALLPLSRDSRTHDGREPQEVAAEAAPGPRRLPSATNRSAACGRPPPTDRASTASRHAAI